MLLKRSHPEITSTEINENPVLAAKVAGLRYVSDSSPGFTRRKKGSGFTYLDEAGKILKDKKHLERIRALVLPPAWKDVWICPLENGHLQATGRDAKGRKQYRYHADWGQLRNETKFTKMITFAEKLPQIRQRIQDDFQKPGMGRERVLASIVKIMEQTMIRIGNDEYAKENESYGLTTIKNKHVEVRGQKVRFRFKGKSGKFHDVALEDPGLARIIRKCQDIPGQKLFGYEDENGNYVEVSSNDVNDYLKEITGENITAKDFRTWGGTVEAALVLQKLGPHQNKTHLKKMTLKAVQSTSERLRNTVSVCRKYYIHPCVFEAYETGSLFKIHARCAKAKKPKKNSLYSEEVFTLRLLENSLKIQNRTRKTH